MESMESQSAGFPPFPHSLEIPSGFPHSHGHGYDEISIEKQRQSPAANQKLSHQLRKGLVTDVPGPICKACPGTLKAVEDDDEVFAEKMERLTAQLAEQMAKGAELDAVIREKLGALGYGV